MKIKHIFTPSIYGLLVVLLGGFFLWAYVVFFASIPYVSLRSNHHKRILTTVIRHTEDVFSLLERTSFQEVSQMTTMKKLQETIKRNIHDKHTAIIAPDLIQEVQISFPNSRMGGDFPQKNVYGFSYFHHDLILKLPVVGVQKGSFQVSVVYDYKKIFHVILQRVLGDRYRVFFTRNGSMMVSLQSENIDENLVQEIGKSIEDPCYGSSTYFFRGQNLYGLCDVLSHVDRSIVVLYRGGTILPVLSQLLFCGFLMSILSLFFVCYKDISSRGESIFFRTNSEELLTVPAHLYTKRGIPVNSELYTLIESIETFPPFVEEKQRDISKERLISVGRSVLQQLFWVDLSLPLLDQIRSHIEKYPDLHYMVLRNQEGTYLVTENEGFSEETQHRFQFSSSVKIVHILEDRQKLLEIDNQHQPSQFLQEKLSPDDVKTHPTLLCVPVSVNKTLHAIICIG